MRFATGQGHRVSNRPEPDDAAYNPGKVLRLIHDGSDSNGLWYVFSV